MNTLQDIEETIKRLSIEDRERLERWFYTHLSSLEGEDWHVAEPAAAYQFPPQQRRMSVDEYFEFEAASPIKHEYVGGELFAMSGVSRAHNHITTNLTVAFHSRLRGGPCEVFVSGFKLKFRIDDIDIVYYPDIMVACKRESIEELFLSEPKLVIEVLSPSTTRTDRREKALNYRRIGAVEEYVLVAQDKPEVTIFRRSARWEPIVQAAPGSIVELRSVGLSLPLAQIYEGI